MPKASRVGRVADIVWVRFINWLFVEHRIRLGTQLQNSVHVPQDNMTPGISPALPEASTCLDSAIPNHIRTLSSALAETNCEGSGGTHPVIDKMAIQKAIETNHLPINHASPLNSV